MDEFFFKRPYLVVRIPDYPPRSPALPPRSTSGFLVTSLAETFYVALPYLRIFCTPPCDFLSVQLLIFFAARKKTENPHNLFPTVQTENIFSPEKQKPDETLSLLPYGARTSRVNARGLPLSFAVNRR
ncbi:MAG TPA: hypothetical protein VGF20_15950 [Candidatus Acidoferrum sp.]